MKDDGSIGCGVWALVLVVAVNGCHAVQQLREIKEAIKVQPDLRTQEEWDNRPIS